MALINFDELKLHTTDGAEITIKPKTITIRRKRQRNGMTLTWLQLEQVLVLAGAEKAAPAFGTPLSRSEVNKMIQTAVETVIDKVTKPEK